MPRVIKSTVTRIINKGKPRHCVTVHTDGPMGKARNGGKLVAKDGTGRLMQGCFNSKAAAQARAAQFPKGKKV